MSNIAILTDDLGKLYRIGQRQQYNTLKDTLTTLMAKPFHRFTAWGKPSFSTVSTQSRTGRRERIWALKDVTFEIEHGEVVGIIGRNGAGKSTLLKILSRITKPTTGHSRTQGRVGSLLEVGTGFHPELTGRENVFLNGAILGMRREEIRRRFDEIVAFAEIEKFIDTPVKRYSSGMYMRLAFAVAAHLEPEILIVDEVLAVGDVEFQKKCLGKMDSVAQAGRTVLFVSHNMDAIQQLCPRCIMLDQGQLVIDGDSDNVIAQYLSSYSHQTSPDGWIDVSGLERAGTGEARFKKVQYGSDSEAARFQPYSNGPIEFSLDIESDSARSVGSLAVFISTQLGTKLINADTVLLGQVIALHRGSNLVRIKIDRLYLNPGVYRVGLWLADPISSRSNTAYDYIESAFEMEVIKYGQQPTIHPNAAVTCQFDVETITQGST
jgi:lipopolysaccharide transport system ATP-binding protein